MPPHKDTIEEKQTKINYWLRYHTTYEVKINLCDMYACVSIQVSRLGQPIWSSWGATLEKRLDEVIKFLEIDKPTSEQKIRPPHTQQELKMQELNEWLRKHPDHDALCNTVNGCTTVQVTRNGEAIYTTFGAPPEAQIERMLKHLETYDPEKKQPDSSFPVPLFPELFRALWDRVVKLEALNHNQPRRPFQQGELDSIYQYVVRRMSQDARAGSGGRQW